VTDGRLHDRIQLGAMMAGAAVAWVNGVEVFRNGLPEGVEPSVGMRFPGSSATRVRSTQWNRWDLPAWTPGTNVLAVMVLPEDANAEVYWNARLEAVVDTTPPVVGEVRPSDGATVATLDAFEVIFGEPVQGVDADDLLFNGSPAVSVVPVASDHYAFVPPPLTNGPVDIRWRGDAAITDRATAANALVGGSWNVRVERSTQSSQVVLSEVMSDNDETLRDEDGDSPDWVELPSRKA
jgi:hypothetical protein